VCFTDGAPKMGAHLEKWHVWRPILPPHYL
jgi:hypothetical protein